MVIQTVVFFICFVFLVFLIVIPVFYGRNLMAFEVAGRVWYTTVFFFSLHFHNIDLLHLFLLCDEQRF